MCFALVFHSRWLSLHLKNNLGGQRLPIATITYMKKRFLFSILAAFLAVAEQSYADDITRAKAMCDDQNYIGAIDQLSGEQSKEADYLRAMASLACGYDEAKTLLEQFVSNYPTSPMRPDAIAAMGDYEFFRGNYGVALTEYQKINLNSLTDNRHEDCLYRISYSRLKLAEYDSALAGFRLLQQTKRYSNAAHFYEGYIAYCKVQYDKAAQLFAKVDTRTAPGNMADFYLSQIHFMSGDSEKALATSKKLLKNSAGIDKMYIAEANRIAGETLYNQGREDEALPYLKEYVSLIEHPMPSALYILGVSEYRAGEYTQAIAHLTPATTSDNAMGQSAYLFIGQAYMKEGNTSAAMMAFEKASSMMFDPAVSETAFYNYAVSRMKGGRVPFGNSVNVFESFLQQFPNSKHTPEVQEYIVAGYMTDGNHEKVLQTIEKIKNPSDKILSNKQQALYSLGTSDLANGKTAQAITRFTEAKALASHNRDIARECDLLIGDCLYQQGKYAQASKSYLAYIGAAKNGSENLPLAYYSLGYSRFAEKRYDDAEVNFNRVIKSPSNLSKEIVADAHNRAGDCLYYAGKFDQATEEYNKAFKTNPSAGDYALYQKALMKGQARDYNGKITALDEMIKKFPSSALIPSALLAKAESYLALSDNEKAIKTYLQLTEKYPDTLQGRNGMLQMAITSMNMGDKAAAIKSYKEIITKYPASDEAKVASDDLKRIYADDGRLTEYASFINSISGAPRLDESEIDALTFQSAEKKYLAAQDTDKLREYINQFPEGKYMSQALYYICLSEKEELNDDAALQHASTIIEKYPDAEAAEDALAVKAEIEYRQGKGELALESYKTLEKRAKAPHNIKAARLGIMRVSKELGKHQDVIAAADNLIASLPAESAEMSEIRFTRAYSLNAEGNAAEAEKEWAELAKDANDLHGAKSAYYLTEYYFKKNRTTKAHEIIETFIESNSPHQYWIARGFILLSDICREEGNTFEADEYLKSLQNNYPGTESDIFRMIDERLK